MRNLTVTVGCALLAGLAWNPSSLVAEETRAASETKKAKTATQKAGKPVAGADVFGHDKVWRFHLTLSAAEYAAMQPDLGRMPGFPGGPMPPPKPESDGDEPKRDIHKGAFFEFPWATASLNCEGQTYEKVGLRYKGNATYGMSSRNLKRSLKVDIDRHDDAARFHGLKSLTLSSGVFDPSKSREALAYSIYRVAGVPAPRTAFAEVTLTVAGKYDQEYVGLYTLLESVDKNFLKLNFGSDAGLLMKPERIPGIVYLGEDWARYAETYFPKREATKREIERVIGFTKLVTASSDDEFNQQIASYLDIDAFLKFMAVTAIVANLDSFHSGHNYCLYLHPKTHKFHFIPWDLDLALGGFPMLGAQEQMELSLIRPYVGQSRLAERLLANKQYAEKYQRTLNEVVPLCFAQDKLLSEIGMIEKVIKPLIEKESAAVNARKENASGFGGASGRMGPLVHRPADLRTFVEKRTESIALQLAGKSEGFTPKGFSPPPGAPGMNGPGGSQARPGEPHRQFTEMLGPPFLVFRNQVQNELRLSDEQKGKLAERLQGTVKDSMQFFQQLVTKEPAVREQEQRAYMQQAQENLMTFLKATLQEEQLSRLRQLILQREGLFALGNPELMKELELTDEQRDQFGEVIKEMQKKSGQLAKEAQYGGKPEEFLPKIMKIRQEQEARIEALLTEAQKKQWEELLGSTFNLVD